MVLWPPLQPSCTLSLLLLSVAVVLVSLVLAASIPYFKKMRELHPADKLIIERERELLTRTIPPVKLSGRENPALMV